jgi:hypothetical protein
MAATFMPKQCGSPNRPETSRNNGKRRFADGDDWWKMQRHGAFRYSTLAAF